MESVVITGASSGIGRDAALYLDEMGYRVFGGVRKQSDANSLKAEASDRLVPIFIDVTDSAQISAAAQQVQAIVGEAGIAGLVNNAGIAVIAPLEFIPIEDLRKQIEINTIAQVEVSQAFLSMLRQGKGRILNISSLSGTVVFPFMGAYAASKFALEAITDALRQELYPWGIDVISIEPGSIETPIWGKGEDDARSRITEFPPHAHELYGDSLEKMTRAMAKSAQGGMPVRRVSEVIHEALTAKSPSTRYFIVEDSWRMRLVRLLPARWRDQLFRRAIGL